ncbi:MAG: aminotransferase class V-fold PLP-dependent enzyme [Niabella sp.]|nr:aminotransferase class V-fold PLP-dependent enzyme [Niabella sp.]
MPTPNTPVYLNTAACGLIPETVQQAGADFYKDFATNSAAAAEHWRDVQRFEIKETIARFMGAAKENVALIPNFSYGINAIVQTLKGDEKVLLYKKDFPSVYIPFVINNFDIVWIDDEDGFLISLEKIEALIREQKINLVAISHVQWQSGFKLDIKTLCSICKQNNVHTIIDATQSLGALHIDIQDIDPDILISSNYKWMNAGFGSGILYMNDAFAQQYPAVISGMHSNTFRFANNQFDFDGRGIDNYEPGSANMFGGTILNAAIEEKNKIGIAAIEAHNAALATTVLEKLSAFPVQLVGPAEMSNRSAIVVVKEERGLHQHLSNNNIITTGRNGLVRISMHYYNTITDVDALVSCIREWAQTTNL